MNYSATPNNAMKRMENESLILDLLEWVGSTPRSYEDVMNAWRTSCPKLTIWEDALDARYLKVRNQEVHITVGGLEFLRARRNTASVSPNHAGV